jgi:hypothetical protein
VNITLSPASVPDAKSTLGLLVMGLAAFGGFYRLLPRFQLNG